MRTVLASASPRRKELLQSWGISFEAIPAEGLDESAVTGSPEEVVVQLAEMKAQWVRDALAKKGEDVASIRFIGSDTVIGFEGEVLGKPKDAEDASQMLGRLSGKSHEVLSGVCVLGPNAEKKSGYVLSEVIFKNLSKQEIQNYVDSGDPFGKAGSYGIQSGGRVLIEGFNGCYYNIVGLPQMFTLRLLNEEISTCDCPQHDLFLSGGEC